MELVEASGRKIGEFYRDNVVVIDSNRVPTLGFISGKPTQCSYPRGTKDSRRVSKYGTHRCVTGPSKALPINPHKNRHAHPKIVESRDDHPGRRLQNCV